jgi:hypothetical protein
MVRGLVEGHRSGAASSSRAAPTHPPAAAEQGERLAEPGLRHAEPGEHRPRPGFGLIAAERFEPVPCLAVLVRQLGGVGVIRAQRGEPRLQLLDLLLQTPQLGGAVQHGGEHGPVPDRLDLLGQVAHLEPSRPVDRARVRLIERNGEASGIVCRRRWADGLILAPPGAARRGSRTDLQRTA